MGNVVELKVGLHCEECIKKIEDIKSYDVDTQRNKVMVTGNVTKEEVIRAIQKIGKQASNWEAEAACDNFHYPRRGKWRYVIPGLKRITLKHEDLSMDRGWQYITTPRRN